MTLNDQSNVYNIPPGYGFAETLAQGLIEETSGDPAKLSDYLLLLPSRRACRILRDIFLRLSGGKALLLPRMHPLGDVDADEVALLLSSSDAGMPDVPPAISKLERQILLARLIFQTGSVGAFDQAAALARDLAAFLDEVQTEGLSFENLSGLVPEEFSAHWQETLQFLNVLTDHWPAILSSRGVIDPAARRNLLLQAQMDAWQHVPPQYPVIAAGSTGTIPAVRDLLSLVARLPQGRLVLPGLDTNLDPHSFGLLDEDHPQFQLKKLIDAVGIARADVKEWRVKNPTAYNPARAPLTSEMMRPAETTEIWRQLDASRLSGSLDHMTRIDCGHAQEEADVIAVMFREALETPGRTAALVTPDRRLARRVTQSMLRWGIAVDDSGGQPLTELPVGSWLIGLAEMARDNMAPVALLSMLKHPIMAAAMPADKLRASIYLLDELVLRGPRPAGSFKGLRDAISTLHEKKTTEKQALLAWLDLVEPLLAPFVAVMSSRQDVSFIDFLTAHITTAENLAQTLERAGSARVWRNEAGDAASKLLQELRSAANDVPDMAPSHYVSFLYGMLKSVTVRPAYGAHPRLNILGQLEARMYAADLVILGGLNEGTWPEMAKHDPWMSRPMRKRFGLPSPEQNLGIAAHDFAQVFCAPDVVLTRSAKVDGTPTVPTRWLMRLNAVLQAVGMEVDTVRGRQYRQWLKDIDQPESVRPIQRPAPTPPVSARPRGLSVTRVEAWMRDPYQIYAQYVLGLRAFDDIDADPGGAERGTFIHAALEQFTRKYPDTVPPDAEDILLGEGRHALAAMKVPPEVEAFWWPRFEKIVSVFIEQEKNWRRIARPYVTESTGTLVVDADTGPFTLTGKADRIDKMSDGGYAVIDYKSGTPPTKSEVESGLSPQLPLEALMIERGAFDRVPPDTVAKLIYWKVTGSGQLPVEQKHMADDTHGAAELTIAAEAGLKALIDHFATEDSAYLSLPRSGIKAPYSDYNHLARVQEWRISGEDEEGDL